MPLAFLSQSLRNLHPEAWQWFLLAPESGWVCVRGSITRAGLGQCQPGDPCPRGALVVSEAAVLIFHGRPPWEGASRGRQTAPPPACAHLPASLPACPAHTTFQGFQRGQEGLRGVWRLAQKWQSSLLSSGPFQVSPTASPDSEGGTLTPPPPDVRSYKIMSQRGRALGGGLTPLTLNESMVSLHRYVRVLV